MWKMKNIVGDWKSPNGILKQNSEKKKKAKLRDSELPKQKLLFILNYKLLDFKLFFKSIYI